MRLLSVLTVLLCIFGQRAYVFAAPNLRIDAPGAVLMDVFSGTVIFEQNAHSRMYPASMSKMLTALVVMDYLDLDDIIVVGPEIRSMPIGYVTNAHFEGESISVHNLLRVLIMVSGNETGRVLAIEVARRSTGNANITYAQAKPIFATLMNNRARELGALNSGFDNPYGLHSNMQYTTPYDMALITRAFMDNPVLAAIAQTPHFEGTGLWGANHPQGATQHYSLSNTNLMLPGGPLAHPFITGAKTGYTTPAGHCLAASADFGGLRFVSVVMGGDNITRWQDTRQLMDYAFFNYSLREVGELGRVVSQMPLVRPPLGADTMMDIVSGPGGIVLLSNADYATLEYSITIHSDFLDDDGLVAPIYRGQEIGTIVYTAAGNIIYQTSLYADADADVRTFGSDVNHFSGIFFGGMFTLRALPYWFGVVGSGIGVFGFMMAVRVSRRARGYSARRYYDTRRGR